MGQIVALRRLPDASGRHAKSSPGSEITSTHRKPPIPWARRAIYDTQLLIFDVPARGTLFRHFFHVTFRHATAP